MVDITQIAAGYGIAVGLLTTFFVVMAIFYVYCAFALMTIAKKLKTKDAWMAWIPLLNYYYLTRISKVNPLWTLALLGLLIPFAGWFSVGVAIWMFWRIAEMRKLPGWISLLLIVPLLNFVILGIIAWYK